MFSKMTAIAFTAALAASLISDVTAIGRKHCYYSDDECTVADGPCEYNGKDVSADDDDKDYADNQKMFTEKGYTTCAEEITGVLTEGFTAYNVQMKAAKQPEMTEPEFDVATVAASFTAYNVQMKASGQPELTEQAFDTAYDTALKAVAAVEALVGQQGCLPLKGSSPQQYYTEICVDGNPNPTTSTSTTTTTTTTSTTTSTSTSTSTTTTTAEPTTVATVAAEPTTAPTAAKGGVAQTQTLTITMNLDGVDLSTLDAKGFAAIEQATKDMAAAQGIDMKDVSEIIYKQNGKVVKAPTATTKNRRASGDITMEFVFKAGAVVDVDALVKGLDAAIKAKTVKFSVEIDGKKIEAKGFAAAAVEVKSGIVKSGASTTGFATGLIAMLATVATLL